MLTVALDPQIAFAQAQWASFTARERAAWVLATLEHRHLRKSELAERLGVSPQTVHAWTSGDSQFDWSRRMSICLALTLPETWEPPKDALAQALKKLDALRPTQPPKARRRTGG